MAFPQNEEQTIQLFRLIQNRIGWHIVRLQIAFPDAIIENSRGQRLVVEFEFDSKNFHAHGHDPMGCDLIVCWHDGWENPPVPVWALEGCAEEEVTIVNEIISSLVPRKIVLGVYNTVRSAIKALGLKPGAEEGLPTLSDEYLWGYELLTNPPENWRWAIGMATPPGWKELASESEQGNAD